MKKYITLGAVAMSLLTTGCSNDLISENSPVDNSGKERIVLGAGDGQSAFVTRAGFSNETRIVARIVSDSRTSTDAAKCVTTVLTATPEVDGKGYSDVKYLDGKTRYWDDAYGRKSILSVYAVAIPNQNKSTEGTNMPSNILEGAETWATANANDNTLVWTVNKTQAYADLANQDLTYSNNIQQSGKKGVWTYDFTNNKYPDISNDAANATEHPVGTDATDGRLYFCQNGKAVNEALTEDPGKFDKGQLEFHHALSRIQVNLKKGAGYDGAISLTSNLQLNAMPYTGTFDVKAGTWSSPSTDVVNMAKWETADPTEYAVYGKAELTYEAQVLPGYEFAESDDNTMQFTIADNTYFITKNMLRAALSASSETVMAKEKRYIFNITVAKNKIENITATIAPWVNVTADNMALDNSHIKFTFKAATGTSCGIEDINFYKYEQDLGNIYTDNTYSAPASGTAGKAFDGPAELSGDGTFATNWYYKDNKTAYHFRTLNDKAAGAMAADKKSFNMAAGATATTDYHWGAPMINSTDTKLAYSKENGFVANVDKGIVAATKETALTIQELHMMSNIVVDLKTVEGAAAIDVTGAEVTITNLYTTASVDMGTGKITPTGDLGDNTMTCGTGDKNTQHTYSVIPQDLNRGSGEKQYVGITIKTKDNNEYYIIADLSTIIADTVDDQRNQTQGEAITTWFPGHTYKYTFTLSKKKIEVITATVANWVNVVGANTDLDLEK